MWRRILSQQEETKPLGAHGTVLHDGSKGPAVRERRWQRKAPSRRGREAFERLASQSFEAKRARDSSLTSSSVKRLSSSQGVPTSAHHLSLSLTPSSNRAAKRFRAQPINGDERASLLSPIVEGELEEESPVPAPQGLAQSQVELSQMLQAYRDRPI